MIWRLWKGKENHTLAGIQDLLSPINQQLTTLNQHLSDSLQQNAEMSEQLRKLGRLQYKSGQEVHGKFESLNTRLGEVQQWQDVYTVDRSKLDRLEQQIGQVSEVLLVWLDDLDLLTTSLREQGQEGWLKLLGTWTHQILQAVRINGLEEMQLVGSSFNPSLAESIGTMVRPPVKATGAAEETTIVSLPYEVAEVVKRGFVYQDGTLLRKAQVITYQEDGHEL